MQEEKEENFFKKTLGKVLTKGKSRDIISKLSRERRRRSLKIKQYKQKKRNKPTR